MNGINMLYIDQYGEPVWAHNLRELKERAGGGRLFKVYNDFDGKSYHVGYGVGSRWFSAYIPYKKPA